MTDWRAFDEALEKYNGAFWWRDDDAISDTASLHQLLNLADSVGAPLTLAVIPANLDETLPKAIDDRNVTVAVHGWSHTNHAPEGEKKAEFRAHRPFWMRPNGANHGLMMPLVRNLFRSLSRLGTGWIKPCPSPDLDFREFPSSVNERSRNKMALFALTLTLTQLIGEERAPLSI